MINILARQIHHHLLSFGIDLLNLMKETENDELTGVIQKLVLKYQEDIIPIAYEMVSHLATIFQQVGWYMLSTCLVNGNQYS